MAIPEKIRARIGRARHGGRRARRRGTGRGELRGVVQGAYIMPPFGRYELAADVIDGARIAGVFIYSTK